MKKMELGKVFDPDDISFLEKMVHDRFDEIDYDNMCLGDYVRLKRKLEDILLLVKRVNSGFYKREEVAE